MGKTSMRVWYADMDNWNAYITMTVLAPTEQDARNKVADWIKENDPSAILLEISEEKEVIK